jgi:hypothetical protein
LRLFHPFFENVAHFRSLICLAALLFEPVLSYAAEFLAIRLWQHSPQPWDQVAQLIASDTITVPTEERVFESVIAWIHHDVDTRYGTLPFFLKIFQLCFGAAEFFNFRPSRYVIVYGFRSFSFLQQVLKLRDKLSFSSLLCLLLTIGTFINSLLGTNQKKVREKYLNFLAY